MLRTEVVKLCQDNNFHTGFFEGTDNSTAVDAYELKVNLSVPSVLTTCILINGTYQAILFLGST